MQEYVDPFSRRIERARTWIDRAGEEANDPDVAFLCYWIAFNAAYGQDSIQHLAAKKRFEKFFHTLLDCDTADKVYDANWNNFSGSIRNLCENKYVFFPFWEYQAGLKTYSAWYSAFRRSKRKLFAILGKKDKSSTLIILQILFDRLYVLRNQLMHGGARWNSDTNRTQVKDGHKIMALLVPLFIDIMESCPDKDWGPLDYPPIDDPAGL